MKMRYKVTAYKRNAYIVERKGKLILTHRWVKVDSWVYKNKKFALKVLNIWSTYKQPFFKATIQSCRKEDKL